MRAAFESIYANCIYLKKREEEKQKINRIMLLIFKLVR